MAFQKTAPARGRGRPALDEAAIDELRAAIVDAAARTFAERGARTTTIDDIAKAAGVSRASVYRYAGGRDELILAVTLRRFGEWVDGVVDHAARFATAGEVVTEAIVWTVRTVHRDPALAALFAGGTAEAASDVLTKRPRRGATSLWHDRFGALLAAHGSELRAGLEPGAVADHVLGVVLDTLSHRDRFDERELRDWVTTWLLPAVLQDRPPLPRSPVPPTSPRTQTPSRDTKGEAR